MRQFRHLLVVSTLVALVGLPALAKPLSEEPNRVMYQVYVETFRDGAALEGLKPEGSGDFDGLRHSLGYLKELGVTGLLLMPIFQGGGMGYIPDDFFLLRDIYARGGSAQDRERNFELFTRAAHDAGIKVFLDTPINHISNGSDWFRKSAARAEGFDDWFLWSPAPVKGWRRPWQDNSTPADVWYLNGERKEYYYGLFSSSMPDLNHESPAVIATFDRFFETYARLGADGFRIDAARHLVEDPRDNTNSSYPGNIDRLETYLATLRKKHPDQSFLLEIWSNHGDIDPYLPRGGDVALDFPFMETLRDSLKHSHPYAVRLTLQHFEKTQEKIGPGSRVIFMGNHDVPRIRTFLADDRARAELAMAVTFTLPQVPMMYYGDELFMPGNYLRDETGGTKLNGVCTPMAWTPGPNAGFTDPSVNLGEDWNRKLHDDWQKLNVETESADPGSMLSLVRELIGARNRLPITPGTRLAVHSDKNDEVLTVAMKFEDGSCAVGLYNFSQAAQPSRSARFAGVCGEKGRSEPLARRRATFIGASRVVLEGRGFAWTRYWP